MKTNLLLSLRRRPISSQQNRELGEDAFIACDLRVGRDGLDDDRGRAFIARGRFFPRREN